MPPPVVAIVGAPNVGKSTLFNRLIGRRKAIVSDRTGVTRDRIAALCEFHDRQATLIDTGGVVTGSTDDLSARVRSEALKAVQEADLILFVVDARAGPTAADSEVAAVLRSSGKPIIPIANKIDAPTVEGLQGDVYRLSLGEVVPLSAEHGRGIGELLDRIHAMLPDASAVHSPPHGVPIALIGRPNVGKSSLFNRIIKGDRALVSPTPGTTRDPIDALFAHGGIDYQIVDTAGIRRHARAGEDVEQVSVIKARQTLEQADIAIALVDGSHPITHQDQALVGLVVKSRKPALLAVNKIDLLEGETSLAERTASIRDALRFSRHVPVIPISALTGAGLDKLLAALGRLRRQSLRRFGTTTLNDALTAIVKEKHPPADRGRPVRFFYMTQVGGPPPHFVIFGNGRRVPVAYRRFLERRLRDHLGLIATPLNLSIRRRPRSR
jgi:GTP-binding protein